MYDYQIIFQLLAILKNQFLVSNPQIWKFESFNCFDFIICGVKVWFQRGINRYPWAIQLFFKLKVLKCLQNWTFWVYYV